MAAKAIYVLIAILDALNFGRFRSENLENRVY